MKNVIKAGLSPKDTGR